MEVEQCREIQFKPKESKKFKLFLKYLSLSERTVCYFLSYNFGMNWKVVLVLAGEVHWDNAHQVDFLVSSYYAVMERALKEPIHDGHWQEVCPGVTSEACAHFHHPVSHLRSELTWYLVTRKWILRSSLSVMACHGSISFDCINKLFSLQGFLRILQCLTVNETVYFELMLHCVELS